MDLLMRATFMKNLILWQSGAICKLKAEGDCSNTHKDLQDSEHFLFMSMLRLMEVQGIQGKCIKKVVKID